MVKLEYIKLENELYKVFTAILRSSKKVTKEDLIQHLFKIAGHHITITQGESALIALSAAIRAEARQYKKKEHFK